MIYTLKASKRKFEVLGVGDEYAKVKFLGERVDDEVTIATGDLEASSDWKRPGAEKPPETPPAAENNNPLYGWVI